MISYLFLHQELCLCDSISLLMLMMKRRNCFRREREKGYSILGLPCTQKKNSNGITHRSWKDKAKAAINAKKRKKRVCCSLWHIDQQLHTKRLPLLLDRHFHLYWLKVFPKRLTKKIRKGNGLQINPNIKGNYFLFK